MTELEQVLLKTLNDMDAEREAALARMDAMSKHIETQGQTIGQLEGCVSELSAHVTLVSERLESLSEHVNASSKR